MGKGEAAMGERGGEEEGTANTKLGEGDVPDEEQEGNQQTRSPGQQTVVHQLLAIVSLHLLHDQN